MRSIAGRAAVCVVVVLAIVVAHPAAAQRDEKPAPVYTCTGDAPVAVPVAGLTLCSGSTTATDALESKGALITAVQTGGVSDVQGLVAGDLIYRIQDVDITTAADAAHALDAMTATSDLVVNFLRNGSIYLVRLRKPAP